MRLRWEIAAKRGGINAIKDGPAKHALQRLERGKASVRARVEHPLRVIKPSYGLLKVRFRGLAKKAAHVITLFALSNLSRAFPHLLR